MQVKLHSYEEKTCHHSANRLCFRHYPDLLRVEQELPRLRRIAKVHQGNALLIQVLGGMAMIALKRPLLRILMFTLLGACPFLLSAQNIDIQSDDDKPIEERLVYTRQNTFKVAIHSQGFGIGFNIGKIKTINRTTNWVSEAVSLHSPKEIKTVTISQYNTRPFVYGKLNHAFVLRFGYGESRRIFGKPYWGGIETRWNYGLGASLALLKPYYYYVVTYQPSSSGGYIEKIDEQTFQSDIDILSRAPFTKGIAETKFSPGAHASVGLSFEFGKSRTRVRAINLEVKAEYFPLGAAIMASDRNKWFYLTFMLSYNWGSRFNNY